LALLSEEFERKGDLAAIIDAAAQATLAYRREGLRGSALVGSAREPLPLNDRGYRDADR
jgi:hypothetical protein